MFRRIHDKLGTAGFIVAVVALVAGLAGTAFAAKDVLTKQEKKQVEKIAKKFAGAPGPAGPQGSTGPQGPAGANGKDGTNGTNGKNVVSGTEAPGANCEEGGYWVEVEGSGAKHYACNGASATGPLRSGETEFGVWGVRGESPEVRATISLPRPVPGSLFDGEIYRHYEGEGPTPECPGNAEEPEAAPGKFCIYFAHISGTSQSFENGELFVHSEGAFHGYVFSFPTEASAEANVFGSWAIKAQ